MTLPEIRCEFVIQDAALDPQEVTDALSLEPTETYRIGDPIVRNMGVRRSNAWILTIGPVRSYDFEGVSTELVERMASATASIPGLCQRLQVVPEIYAPIYVYDEFPNLKFPQAVVQWAANVGAAIAVDVFDLRELAEH